MPQCQAKTANGAQCRRPTRGVFCASHDPERAEERQASLLAANRKQAGLDRAPKAKPPTTRADLGAVIAETIAKMQSGRISVSRGEAIIRGAKVQLSLVRRNEEDEEQELSRLSDADLVEQTERALATFRETMVQ